LLTAAGLTEDEAGASAAEQKASDPRDDVSDQIPVFGFGSAGEGITVGDSGYPVGQSDFWVPRSMDNRDPHAYATRVSGRSMAPYLEPDDLVEVRTDVEVRTGNVAVVIAKDGRKWIKRVEILSRKQVVRCVPLNPHEEPFELPYEELSRMHKVVGMKRKGMY
jgi:phage repressor protein C with HTH and peptisase S24 domain